MRRPQSSTIFSGTVSGHSATLDCKPFLIFLILIVLVWAAIPSVQGETASSRDGGPSPAVKREPPPLPAVVGGVVRSKEWLVRRAPQREEEFIGEVSYRQGPRILTADWALLRHATQIWNARGHVKLDETLKSGDRIAINGEEAQYDQKTKRGWLIGAHGGPISFQRLPVAGPPPDEGTAQRLEWEGQERAHLSGGVHVGGPRAELWGGAADYDALQQVLTVSQDRPVLHVMEGGWTGAVQGTTLAALQNPDRFQADGQTHGWIKFKDNPEKMLK